MCTNVDPSCHILICLILDPCEVKNGDCGEGATCTSNNGTVKCACKPGFSINPLNDFCEDVDECSSSPCKAQGWITLAAKKYRYDFSSLVVFLAVNLWNFSQKY